MKRIKVSLMVLGALLAQVQGAETDTGGEGMTLWYNQPAAEST
ncbi:hypothetical protein [Pontiella sp.]